MRHSIDLAPGAVRDLRGLSAFERTQVRNAIERHLRHEPEKVSRSRIKRLRGLRQPQYRLREGEIRVFYDVSRGRVEVLAIVSKAQAEKWLGSRGVKSEKSGSGED
jgi:mRNA-degrading endonuclease RelE of RelBE toxin-antitoxin system